MTEADWRDDDELRRDALLRPWSKSIKLMKITFTEALEHIAHDEVRCRHCKQWKPRRDCWSQKLHSLTGLCLPCHWKLTAPHYARRRAFMRDAEERL